MLIPQNLFIETVSGACTAACPFCAIHNLESVKVMPNEDFNTIVDKLITRYVKLKNICFTGMGEPLMDKGLPKKIEYAKSRGVEKVYFPTNASLLYPKKAKAVLDSGVDEVIISIDSLKKDIYEKIRLNLKFEKVIKNATEFIKLRDEGNYDTHISLRMIITEDNDTEGESYKKFWSDHLSYDKGDLVLNHPEHNWADSSEVIKKTNKCNYVYNSIVINAYGQLELCCIDIKADFFDLGNIHEDDDNDLFNSKIYKKIRTLMDEGRINEIDPCKYCNVPLMREERGLFDGL